MCGGQSDARAEQIELPPRPSTATRPRTDRPRTSQHPPRSSRAQSSHGQSSRRPPTSARPSSSSRPSSSRQHDYKPRTSAGLGGQHLGTVIEDETTDADVIYEIKTLRTLISQYVWGFYDRSGQAHGIPTPSFVRREIAISAIEDIIRQNIDGATVAQDLLDRLARYALDRDDLARTEGLIQICRAAGRVRRRSRKHVYRWEFGRLEDDAEVLFPQVTVDGRVVMEAQFE